MTKKKINFKYRWGWDKKMHMIAGFVISILAGFVAGFMQWMFEITPFAMAIIITAAPILAGILKEVSDMTDENNYFDIWDMMFTWVGGLPMIIAAWGIYLYA